MWNWLAAAEQMVLRQKAPQPKSRGKRLRWEDGQDQEKSLRIPLETRMRGGERKREREREREVPEAHFHDEVGHPVYLAVTEASSHYDARVEAMGVGQDLGS